MDAVLGRPSQDGDIRGAFVIHERVIEIKEHSTQHVADPFTRPQRQKRGHAAMAPAEHADTAA